jgi:N-acetylglucosaminyldiphosphoundecaprenol N-acetyl-beta-D-mannosaminyltransferase
VALRQTRPLDTMPVPPTTMPLRPAPPSTAVVDAAGMLTILGVAIDDISVDAAIAALTSAATGRDAKTAFFVNAHTLNHAADSADYRNLLNAADLVLGDGTGVRWAARLQGIRVKANLNGTDLMPAFMAAADHLALRYYLLGASPAVVAATATVCQQRFPGWTLAGHHHGYVDSDSTDAVIAGINDSGPHLLLVAMGNPMQERWIDANRVHLRVNLCVGVGGLFSYLSGDYVRAPLWIRRLGLEWLAVSVMQPHKFMRYLRGNPLFLWRVARERVSGGRRP